jgi:hypothetical protein
MGANTVIHFNERLPRTSGERDPLAGISRIGDGLHTGHVDEPTDDEMDEMEDPYDYYLETCTCALMCVNCDPASPWCDFHGSYMDALREHAAAVDAEAADERRDEALWQAEEARIEQEREMERRALFAACEGDDGPY